MYTEIRYVMIGFISMGVFFVALIIIIATIEATIDSASDAINAALYGIAIHLVAIVAFLTSMMTTWYVYVYTNNNIYIMSYTKYIVQNIYIYTGGH